MAAGLGFKTFTTGEVLTAGDVNGYLMQGINVFASSAARAAAITSPQEGQYSFLKDTNALEYYDGAAWVGAPVGDITAVTAGTGISGGGSSGDVTITNTMATAITTAGDLIRGTGAGTFTRLGIGSTGQVLTVSGGAPAWATAASSTPTVNWVRLTSGTSWSVPSGIKSATIWAIAGGGGGGSGRGDGNKYPGGGGGAGGLQMGTFDLSSVAGSTISYAIGAGGAGGAQNTGTGNTGTNGGNTTFGTSGQAWYLSATGGGGGNGGNSAPGSNGGCGGGNAGANVGLGAGGGGGGLSSGGGNAQPYPATGGGGNGGWGSQGNQGGLGSRGDQATYPGMPGSGIVINNYFVGGGGFGGTSLGNNYTADTAFGAKACNPQGTPSAATANTGSGGAGGCNESGVNTGWAGGTGGSGVIFIQYLS